MLPYQLYPHALSQFKLSNVEARQQKEITNKVERIPLNGNMLKCMEFNIITRGIIFKADPSLVT